MRDWRDFFDALQEVGWFWLSMRIGMAIWILITFVRCAFGTHA
jgi:hypothetical protein